MARIKRMSLALVLALIMMMALAGTALAFNPPDNAPVGVGANNLCETDFPAGAPGEGAFGTGVGPWNAAQFNPAGVNPIDFGSVAGNEC